MPTALVATPIADDVAEIPAAAFVTAVTSLVIAASAGSVDDDVGADDDLAAVSASSAVNFAVLVPFVEAVVAARVATPAAAAAA